MPLAPSALRVTYCLVVVPPASPLLGLPRCTTPVVASVCLTASCASNSASLIASKQALIRLYISSISAALLMASIEAQISAAFAADAPKTQFVRPTDADAWGGSTDKKTWTKPTDEKKPEGPQSLEDGRWGPSTDELTFYARKSWADRQPESVAHGELKERAKQGDRIAACDLGILHLLGERGARKSGKEALRYFTESAEAGDARAATNLAVLLSRGDGVAKDPAAAVRWYGVAAQSKTKSKLRDMHDLRSVPRPPPPTPPPPPPVRTFSEEAPDVSTSTNASSADAAAAPDAPESPGDAPVEEDAVVDVVEEDTAPGDDPVPAVAEEPDVSAA